MRINIKIEAPFGEEVALSKNKENIERIIRNVLNGYAPSSLVSCEFVDARITLTGELINEDEEHILHLKPLVLDPVIKMDGI